MILSLLARRAAPAALPATWPLNGADWPLVLSRRPGSRRVTLRLCAVSDTLRIGAPPRCPAATIAAMLAEHAPLLARRAAKLPPRIAFSPGAEIPFQGGALTLVHAPAAAPGLDETAATLTLGGRPEHLPRRTADALKRAARTLLSTAAEEAFHRAAPFSPRPIRRIAVADTRGRWGSCAADGTLRFSWRLVLAPPEILAYVVAHEVAHLADMSHSPRFWQIVAKLDPEFGPHRAWLKRHGIALHRIGPPLR
ncbi:SprT family zinc-dependent metalloprotease [Oleispirillum naphthae]|uniref:M48 family metallopeptidase n=1 Tax=Oleispirillum naphthae TaxID=2838853 RepID=UPI0030826408